MILATWCDITTLIYKEEKKLKGVGHGKRGETPEVDGYIINSLKNPGRRFLIPLIFFSIFFNGIRVMSVD